MKNIYFILLISILSVSSSFSQTITQVSFGSFLINGDVDVSSDLINSFHVSLNKPIRSSLFAEAKVGIARISGLSADVTNIASEGGILVKDVYQQVGSNSWYPNYLTTYGYLDLGVNYRPYLGTERVKLWGGAGIGLSLSSTYVNLFRGPDMLSYNLEITGSDDDIKNSISQYYDQVYETRFDEANNFTPHLYGQLGFQIKLTDNLYFSADVRHHITNNDYLDAIQYESPISKSGDNDSVSMFTVGIMGYLIVRDTKEPEKPQ